MTQATEMLGPRVRLAGREVAAFHVCGLIGLTAGVALSVLLAGSRGLSIATIVTLSAGAVATVLAVAMVAKMLTGTERLTSYRDQIAVIAAAAAGLTLAGRPVLPYLDPMMLGVGAFVVFGRIGCTLAGCCHGRPARHGIHYGHAHAAEGLPEYLVGIPLVPVQLLEAAWMSAVVATGSALVLAGSAPGTAFATYVVGYAAARYGLEFLRGDAARSYRAGLSSNQWLSLVLAAALVVAESTGVLPRAGWQLGAAGALLLAAVAIGLRVQLDPRVQARRVGAPQHVQEVAAALAHMDGRKDVAVEQTSLGIRISASRVAASGGTVRAVTVSSGRGVLDEHVAAALEPVLRLVLDSPAATLHPTPSGAWQLVAS